MQKALFHIGTEKEVVVEARKTILDILKTENEQDTKRKALETLTALCQANNNSFMNCSFVGESAKKK